MVKDRASINIAEEEDRISNLPYDIIHLILHFLDMKYAVQTSALSKKWKHIWTTMPRLNFISLVYDTLPQFAKFVKHALSHRNNHTEVFAVDLAFTGALGQFVVKNIVKYAFSHNVRELTIKWFNSYSKVCKFPQCFFSCHTLKHLILATNELSRSGCCVPKSAWDFPALETMELMDIQFGEYEGDESLDLFSKCVNLKNLTLDRCYMFGVNVFNVCAPQLTNLTITHIILFPKVLKVVAPKLENLTAVTFSVSSVIFLPLSTEGLDSLQKVNLSLFRFVYPKKNYVPHLLNVFQKLCSAKYLILNTCIIEALSSCPDQLLLEPSPFNKLKFLKMEMEKDDTATMPTHVKNYFFESSPDATLIMDLPPMVSQKRSREEVDNNANKLTKLKEEKQQLEEKRMLKAKIQMRDEEIAEQKAKMEAFKLENEKWMSEEKAKIEALRMQNEKLMSRLINSKMSELQMQIAGGNLDYGLISSIKSIIELTPECLRVPVKAQILDQYEKIKNLYRNFIDAIQWAKIETELDIASV